jgi:hypothetical protein
MKTKKIIIVVSSTLNLVLLAVLAYSTNSHNRAEGALLPAFHYMQRLPDVVMAQYAAQKGTIAGIAK